MVQSMGSAWSSDALRSNGTSVAPQFPMTTLNAPVSNNNNYVYVYYCIQLGLGYKVYASAQSTNGLWYMAGCGDVHQ
jgi:hypothetical protein